MTKKKAIEAIRAEWHQEPLEGFNHVFGEGFYSDVEYGVFWDDLEIIVVFRGTDSFLNVLLDVALPFTMEVDGGRISRGIMFALWSIRNDVRKIIHEARLEGKQLSFVGHSLGGAIAGYFAFDYIKWLRGQLPSGINIFSFNCPRWCDKDFSQSFNKSAFCGSIHVRGECIALTAVRYWHRRDPVSHLPFLGWGFAHMGNSIAIGKSGIPLPRYHDLAALEESDA